MPQRCLTAAHCPTRHWRSTSFSSATSNFIVCAHFPLHSSSSSSPPPHSCSSSSSSASSSAAALLLLHCCGAPPPPPPLLRRSSSSSSSAAALLLLLLRCCGAPPPPLPLMRRSSSSSDAALLLCGASPVGPVTSGRQRTPSRWWAERTVTPDGPNSSVVGRSLVTEPRYHSRWWEGHS